MERITITSTHYHMRHHPFSLTLVWFGGDLQWATTRHHQIYQTMFINIFFKKMTLTRGNQLQMLPQTTLN